MSYRKNVTDAAHKIFDCKHGSVEWETARENYFNVVRKQLEKDIKAGGLGSTSWLDMELPTDYITDIIACHDNVSKEQFDELISDICSYIVIMNSFNGMVRGDGMVENFDREIETLLEDEDRLTKYYNSLRK